ncbi:MAG: ATP-binding protein [Desulfatirhabdiaceae bacterium]
MDILIIDNDSLLCQMMKNMITSKGHRVTVCENRQKAWEISNKFSFNLILAECLLTERTGIDLFKAIRASATSRYPYIILMMTAGQKQDMAEVPENGADDYILKPFQPDDLYACIKFGERIVQLEEKSLALQKRLIESRNKIQIVIDSLPQKILFIDRNFRIVLVNKAFLYGIEMTFDEVIGQSCLQNHFWNSSPTFIRVLQDHAGSVFKNAVSENRFETQIVNNGRTGIFAFNFLPIKNDVGHVCQVSIVCHDITVEQLRSEEVIILNQQLQEAVYLIREKNNRLEETVQRLKETRSHMFQSEKMASIGQLAAGIAHEINNPVGFVSSNLNALKRYHEDIYELMAAYRSCCAQIIVSDSMDHGIRCRIHQIMEMEKEMDIDYSLEDIPNMLKESQDGIDRIKKIVLDLKDFSHPGKDVLKLADLNHNLDSTLNIVWNELKYKATITRDYGEIPQVKCWPQQLNQVFMNILVNAGQSIEKQGEIYISTCLVDQYAEITVRDTGCGIPEKNLSRIFDPFFTTKEVGKGTGLGLNVVYNIIQKHQGTIRVDSAPGIGSTFIIRVPVNGPESDPEMITWN